MLVLLRRQGLVERLRATSLGRLQCTRGARRIRNAQVTCKCEAEGVRDSGEKRMCVTALEGQPSLRRLLEKPERCAPVP